MTRKARAGLLPMYLKLYDDFLPERRRTLEEFLEQVVQRLTAEGIDVTPAGVCRVAEEFDEAVAAFERKEVDAIVTLHLAYSPSLESIGALTRTALPIVILDTTMDFDFGPGVSPDRIMFNHGIHGVMDMASVLRRRGRAFEIVAGHSSESDVMARAADRVRAAVAARMLAETRALRIGESFAGMGDFFVADDVLAERLGIRLAQAAPDALEPFAARVSDSEVQQEIELDRGRFVCDLPAAVHERSVRLGLGLRRMLDEGGYDAFSINFLAFQNSGGPANTVPFLEASKAMARGIGYAGEGDVLTAALVGALQRTFGRTTFTEIFCPDWKGESLFLSHMGEVNPDVASGKPRLIEKQFDFTPAQNPAVITCAPRQGPAVFVNLAPGPDDSFSLILAPVHVLPDCTGEMQNVVRGWIMPERPVAEFLEAYSACGGTHHSALVLGDRLEALDAFSSFAGLECTVI